MHEGTRLGAYEILEPLGKGGMGEVYRARDTGLERDVALKVLPDAVASNSEQLARFRREARLLAQLNHPGIVTIYSVEESAGTTFLTMELVKGHTLATEIDRGALPLDRFFEISAALAEAVAAAHAKGITHRDLKPANVMLTDDGRIKVLDFGLARATANEPVSGATQMPTEVVTQKGLVVGTIPYMSPEQVEGASLDHRTDIFSLGVLLYEMATGRRPFRGDTAPALMSSILRDAPPHIVQIRTDLPRHLGRILARCLEKSPQHRYQSATDLAYEIQSLIREHSGSALAAATRAAHTDAEGSASSAQKPIAVLPFVNRSSNPDDQYFSDGLSEELINALGKVPGIRVTARSSAFQFRGQEIDAREVGRKLGVEAVLEGSVRIAGSRLRITVELVSCADGYQLWSERFDGEMTDIFDTQDEIVRAIVEQFEAELDSDAEVPALKRETDNLEAYHLLLKARHHGADFWEPGLIKAIECLEQAIALDPGYAQAHVELAFWYLIRSIFGTLTGAESWPHIRQQVLRALELDPQLGDAHAIYGIYLAWHDLDWDAADRELRRAIELNPEHMWNHFWYAGMLSTARRGDEILPHTRAIAELDPLNPVVAGHVGLFLFYADRLDEAFASLRESLELFPNFWFLYYLRGMLSWKRRDGVAAIDSMRRAVEMTDGKIGFMLCCVAAMCFFFGDEAEGERWLARIEELSRTTQIDAFGYTLLETVRGNTDAAIAAMERGREERDMLFVWTRAYFELQGIITDPRIREAMERLGLP